MHFNKIYEKNVFDFLPFLGCYRNKNWEAKMKSNIKEEQLNEFQHKILKMIENKMWSKSEYVSFKTNLTKINNKDMKYCYNTILNLLSLSDSYIIENLKDFSKLQTFYPFNEKKKDKETGEYFREVKEITSVDCFAIVTELTKKIRSYTSNIAYKFLNNQDDVYACIDIIIEVLNDKDEKTKEKFFELFDKEFGYLKESKLFCEIYNEYRKDFLDILLNALAFRIQKIRTGTNQNIDMYAYIKEKRTLPR